MENCNASAAPKIVRNALILSLANLVMHNHSSPTYKAQLAKQSVRRGTIMSKIQQFANGVAGGA